MKRPVRGSDGTYLIKGKKYKELFGSREQVVNGTAYKTEGLLTKDDLIMNKWGRIVSKKKYKTSKQEMRLEKYGYGAKKGKFGYVKIGKNHTRKNSRSRKNKGGDVAPTFAPNYGLLLKN
jgi:DVNP family